MVNQQDLLLALVGLGLIFAFGGAFPSAGTSLPLGLGISTAAGIALLATVFIL